MILGLGKRERLPTPVFWPGEFWVTKSRTGLSDFHFHFVNGCWAPPLVRRISMVIVMAMTVPNMKAPLRLQVGVGLSPSLLTELETAQSSQGLVACLPPRTQADLQP